LDDIRMDAQCGADGARSERGNVLSDRDERFETSGSLFRDTQAETVRSVSTWKDSRP
jgi:hypothetical protein